MTRSRFALGLTLTAVAGAVDAVVFLRFGAPYASFMSGNLVQTGIQAAAGTFALAGAVMVLIGSFMAGAFAGALLLLASSRWHVASILVLEATAVGAALWTASGGPPPATIALLAAAMGAQNNLVLVMRGANPGTTFVTGTLFRFSASLAHAVLGRAESGGWSLNLAVVLAFAAGAATGAAGAARLGDLVLAPVVVLLVALAVGSLVQAATAVRRTDDTGP